MIENKHDIHIISCESKNFVYMKIPKVAGTSILRNVLEQEIEDIVIHKRKEQKQDDPWYSNMNQEKLSKYFSFVFVRNPWEKIVSLYSYFKLRDLLIHCNSFKQFVLDGKSAYTPELLNHSIPQYLYFQFMKIDFVGRYENLKEDWHYIAKKLGVSKELPVSNKSNHRHYTEYYDEETIEIIRKEYQRDIELLNYRYGD